MIYKNIKHEFEYILWLRERIKTLNFGISRKIKTDSTTDFELLTRKLNSYQQEFNLVVDELNSLLKDGNLLTKIDNIGQESGALSIRDAYSCWPKKEDKEKDTQTHKGRSNGGSETKRSQCFSSRSNEGLFSASHESEDCPPN